MKSWSYKFVFSILAVSQIGLANKPDAQKATTEWAIKMQELFGVFSHLLTDLSSTSQFNSPKNHARIIKEAKTLAKLTHKLGANKMKSPDYDPTLAIVGRLLHEQTEIALSALQEDKPDFARRILRTIPSYCISCHVRNTSGPQLSMLSLEPSHDGLAPVELGQFYAATRQFDRALEQFRLVLLTKDAQKYDRMSYENAAHESLSITVRVKADPAMTKEIVEDILKSPVADNSLKNDARAWKNSISEWEQENLTKENSTKEMLAKAKVLLSKASTTQTYQLDRTADISLLRASAILHTLLQRPDLGADTAEVLFLTGRSYEVLRPIRTEDLQTLYYEACIVHTPHSLIAQRCYASYKEEVLFGFSGSSGTHLPKAVSNKLQKLEAMSKPLSKHKNK